MCLAWQKPKNHKRERERERESGRSPCQASKLKFTYTLHLALRKSKSGFLFTLLLVIFGGYGLRTTCPRVYSSKPPARSLRGTLPVHPMTTEIFMTTGTTTRTLPDSRRRFSVDDYYRMADVGILGPDDRVELLDGQVVQMSPIGVKHAHVVDTLTDMLFAVRETAIIRVQNPVRLDRENEPEPDLSLLKRRPAGYTHGHPGPTDVLLIIEVCDSSIQFDREMKLPLYARFKIPEVWLVDLQAGCVDVHRNPTGHTYTEVTRVKPPAKLQPAAFPGMQIDTARLFPR